jgi:hypothetical protein
MVPVAAVGWSNKTPHLVAAATFALAPPPLLGAAVLPEGLLMRGALTVPGGSEIASVLVWTAGGLRALLHGFAASALAPRGGGGRRAPREPCSVTAAARAVPGAGLRAFLARGGGGCCLLPRCLANGPCTARVCTAVSSPVKIARRPKRPFWTDISTAVIPALTGRLTSGLVGFYAWGAGKLQAVSGPRVAFLQQKHLLQLRCKLPWLTWTIYSSGGVFPSPLPQYCVGKEEADVSAICHTPRGGEHRPVSARHARRLLCRQCC